MIASLRLHLTTAIRYEEEEDGKKRPVAASWIDVAMTRYSNPCGDLSYFLYNSTSPQLRRTHLGHLLGHYHDTLARCLAQLGESPVVYSYRKGLLPTLLFLSSIP